MNVRRLAQITLVGIVLVTVFYVLPRYAENYRSLTGAAVMDTKSGLDPVAFLLLDGDLQEAKEGEYLVARGKTIKVLEVTDETALLEAGGKNYFIALGKKIRVHDAEILLSGIK